MILLAGLGNPGQKFARTRHNLGAWVVGEMKSKIPKVRSTSSQGRQVRSTSSQGRQVRSTSSQGRQVRRPSGARRSRVASSTSSQGRQDLADKVKILLPQTFMNDSGESVKGALEGYNLKAEHLWLFHDDFELPLGRVRVRFGGSAGSHQGVESVIKAIGHDGFWRVRLGTGPLPQDKEPKDFVLEEFASPEVPKVKKIIDKVVQFILESLERQKISATTFEV